MTKFAVRIIITVLVSLSCRVVMAQMSLPTPLKLGSAPISEQAATVLAKQFLDVCGLPTPKTGLNARLSINSKGATIWELRWGGDYEVDLNANTGQPLFFDNNRRIWEQVHGIGRAGKKFSTRELAAKEVWRLARLLSLPSDGYLARLDITDENDLDAKDENKAGSIGANFSVKPNGYPFLGRGNGMSIVIDPVDGQLVFFTQSWDVLALPAVLRLTKDQAISTGVMTYRVRHPELVRSDTAEMSPPAQAELGYVQPNQVFLNDASAGPDQFQVKLAWVVYKGGEKIYIDANDGTVIGGEQLKQNSISDLAVKPGQLPPAEYRNTVPLHLAIQSATVIRIYGMHMMSKTQFGWDNKPLAILSEHSHADMFHLLKTTRRFGRFGIKSIPRYALVFTMPNQPAQGYIFNGVLSKRSILGESALPPAGFISWLEQHPSPAPMKARAR